VSASADQVTQCKTKINEGYPGQTDPDSFPYLLMWIKRSEREEQDRDWKCCALLSRNQNGKGKELYCESIRIDSVSGHPVYFFPGCFSLQ